LNGYNEFEMNLNFDLNNLMNDVYFLLNNEGMIMNEYKAAIEKEKERITQDINYFLNEIFHILADDKIKMFSKLDDNYKNFI